MYTTTLYNLFGYAYETAYTNGYELLRDYGLCPEHRTDCAVGSDYAVAEIINRTFVFDENGAVVSFCGFSPATECDSNTIDSGAIRNALAKAPVKSERERLFDAITTLSFYGLIKQKTYDDFTAYWAANRLYLQGEPTMKENTIYRITYGTHSYGIVFHENRIGISRGYGRIKYMPVVFNYSHHFFPALLKTRLSMAGTAQDLADNLVTCARIKTSMLECIQVCEHILANGRTPR